MKQKRNTKTKEMVMSVMESSNTALCHEDIERQLSGTIDRVTIYRILQGFCDDGKAHKIIGDDGKTYYALCHDCAEGEHHDNHLHFRCLQCETVTCLDEVRVTPELPQGYSLSSVTVFASGLCAKCQPVMMRTCLVLLFCMAQWGLMAQTGIRVLDKSTDEPVAGANVYYPDMKTGAFTDADGMFQPPASNRPILVQVSCMGYRTLLETFGASDAGRTIYLEPSVHELQEIVVSDNTSRLQGEHIMNVAKLSLHQNGEIQGLSLAEKLSSVAGVSNWSTGAGIGKPVIRGLGGNRIAVFSQGVRIENQQWGDEHGLGLDEHGYEQVEIIKGPASLLYGSDALGGVLYFADERYAKDNSIEAALGSEYHTNTEGWRNTAALKLSKNRFHWNAFGGYTTHRDYADGNGARVDNSRFHTGDFKSSLGYTGRQFISSLKYNYQDEQYGLVEPDEEPDGHGSTSLRRPESPFQVMRTHLASWENTVFFENESRLKIDAGYVFNNRREYEEAGDAALDMNLRTASYSVKWYSPLIAERWKVTAGSQGMYQTNDNRGEEMLIPDATAADAGLFVVSDFNYTKEAFWQAGVRVDGRRIAVRESAAPDVDTELPLFAKSYRAATFSTGVYQPLAERMSLRANLSSGFRAPNMFELLSDGVHEGTNRYETGNAQLKTENSYQADASLDYRSKHFELYVNPYFNYIRNYIGLQPTGDRLDDHAVYSYTQTDARLYGGEAGFHLHPHPLDWLHIEASYAGAFGQDAASRALPLMPQQKIKATVSVSFTGWKAVEKFSVYVHNRYSFDQRRVAAYETPTGDYYVLDAGIACEFAWGRQQLFVNVAANNLLDETYYDHLSRYKADEIYNMGRNVCIKLRIPFRWKIN
jgi:iron complex outermembrane receptor protein